MTLEYTVTYAGIPFIIDVGKHVRLTPSRMDHQEKSPVRMQQPLADLVDELNRKINIQEYLQDIALPPNYPGKNLGAIASQWQIGPEPNSLTNVGDFYYPPTASRWSVFRGLATSSMVKAMLAATGGSNFATFTMQASPISPDNPDNDVEAFTVSTDMRMLPPRPLAEHGGSFDGIYLVTLVDERWDWQYISSTIRLNQNTTWASLIIQIANDLNVTITLPSIPAVYAQPEPDSQFWTNSESSATLLDAVAFNVGCTIVRGYDGTYSLQTPLASQTAVANNRGNALTVVRTAGGDMFYDGTAQLPVGNLNAARNSVLPSSVEVTFPKYVQEDDPVPHFLNTRYTNQRPSSWYEDSYGDTYSVLVPIASGNGNVSGMVGMANVSHTLHTTAKALYSGEVQAVSGNAPINVSGLTALSLQLAQDYWNNQVAAALDEVYPGIVNWTPEGIHDVIFSYSARTRQAVTRVMRSEWNQIIREFQHSSPALSGFTNVPKGVGGKSVAQTIRDSFSGSAVTTTLTFPLYSGSMVAVIEDASHLPTQNRWQGMVENEAVLFEGSSGGLSSGEGPRIDVVYRGIYGTLEIDHDIGKTVEWTTPNVSYGVNFPVWEKGQFVHPAEWTSGGIQGVRVVPQTQTIEVLSASGASINGVTHYSGVVNVYDPVGGSLNQEERVWAINRNGNTQGVVSGSIYDGQLVGYSASGPVAPIYLINEFRPGVGSGLGVTWSGNIVTGVSCMSGTLSVTTSIFTFSGGILISVI